MIIVSTGSLSRRRGFSGRRPFNCVRWVEELARRRSWRWGRCGPGLGSVMVGRRQADSHLKVKTGTACIGRRIESARS